MRRRARIGNLVALAIGLSLAALGTMRIAHAVDGGTGNGCMLPQGAVTCQTNPECAPFNALCDTTAGACFCPKGDMSGVISGSDAGSGGGGGTGGTGGGPGGSGVPIHGGGQTLPPRSGCSYIPGQVWP